MLPLYKNALRITYNISSRFLDLSAALSIWRVLPSGCGMLLWWDNPRTAVPTSGSICIPLRRKWPSDPYIFTRTDLCGNFTPVLVPKIDMPPHILKAFSDSVWTRRPAYLAYHREYSTDTIELSIVPPQRDDDVSVRTLRGTSISDPKDAEATAFGLPQSVQRFKQRFIGWRSGVLSFAICCLVVFLINVGVTIWGALFSYNGTLMEGDCKQVKYRNTGLHVIINIFSTILLSGSNYCMQCLSAPTREDVDRAHAKGIWLDIGVPSFRNLTCISKERFLLWFLLGLSSLPLHLL
jgi:hypothetical protein